MGIAESANPWWMDVLENGPSSRFARFFDIEWHPVKDELADKILIPILGDQYGAVLERQELQLAYRDGTFVVRYYDRLGCRSRPTPMPRSSTTELEQWARATTPVADADELQSMLTATRNLPARSDRDPASDRRRARARRRSSNGGWRRSPSASPDVARADRVRACAG